LTGLQFVQHAMQSITQYAGELLGTIARRSQIACGHQARGFDQWQQQML